MLTDRFPLLKGLILDMDGVLWRDNEAIGNLPQIFDTIRKLGLSFVLATNNSTKTVESYIDKLNGFGVSLKPWQVIGTAQVTLEYLKHHFPAGSKVYVLGSDEMKRLFSSNSFHVLELDESPYAEAVVVGLDKMVNYETLRYASQLIRKGARFIATNTDGTFPVPGGFIPGAGTIVKAVEVASVTKPIVIGKPEPLLFQRAMQLMGTIPTETMAVGDRLETDIQGAHNAGILNALVLSGVATVEDSKKLPFEIDQIADNLWELLNV
ncbi:MAG TPA: HAD-IIA family hydrolase [Anaerolineaceae bacterium]|nr:HAD-IIA family hydrolase [Anaerolineaceae bacterium]